MITLAGPTHVSRVGASILHAVGLSELVAGSPDEYLQKALELARDADRLGSLRRTMRERLKASSLLDARGFAEALENAYREMWDRWVQSEEAAQPPSQATAIASEVQ